MGYPVYVEPYCYDGIPTAVTKKLRTGQKLNHTKPADGEVNFEMSDFFKLFERIGSIIGSF